MFKKISITIISLFFLVGCATTDIMPKRKACTGENNTLADLVCKK
tara:strand:- start:661 stop:795 length:135 start_codon:yes stop_codon:yes gene_type:complete